MVTPTRAALLVGYKAGSDVAGRLAVFAILVLAARGLTLADFGLLSIATTIGWLGSTCSDFGLQLHLSRGVSRSPTQAGAQFWPLLRFRLATGAAAIALATLVCLVITPQAWAACALVAAAPILTSIGEFVYYGFRALDRSDVESTLLLAQRLAALGLAVLATALMPSLWTFGAALAVPAGAATLIALRLATRMMPVPPGPVRSALTLASWRQHVAPIGIGLVLSVVYFRVDVFFLERWTTLETVAKYSAVFRIVDGMRLLPAAVIAVALPRILGARDSAFTGRLSLGLFVSGGAVAAIVLFLASPIVLVAYGPQYETAVPIFKVLLLSTPLLAVNLALTHQLIGWHRQAAYAWTCASALVANLALNAWLIPAAGGIGAAWATLGTELVVTAGCLVGLYRTQTSR